jgi:hypothetical protein
MDGLREGSLDCGEGGLDLPAAVGSAVVGEDGLPEGHKADDSSSIVADVILVAGCLVICNNDDAKSNKEARTS